jgi:hypothetical protein
MPKKKSRKPIPRFDNDAQEHEFWSAHDSTDYVDWSRATRVTFGRLKPSTQTISIFIDKDERVGCGLYLVYYLLNDI